MTHRSAHVQRIRIISLIVVLLAVLLIGRLYQIQVIDAAYYEERAAGQYVHTTTELYDRGSILFQTRGGNVLSAASVKGGYVLVANPTLMRTDAQTFCTQLAPYLTRTPEHCVERVTIPGRSYVELADKLDEQAVQAIHALELDGVQLYRQQWRFYPGSSMAARTIGFVGYAGNDNDLRGRYGLERFYDDVLFKEREVLTVNFFAELFSNLGDLVYNRQQPDSGDIVTTLEPSVSRMLDSKLQEVQEQYGSRLTGAIIMDPDTGAIIAMNALPSFDPNDRRSATIEQFQNPLVENVYEFGSTIKALTVAAGLDAGVITPQSTYYDSGSIELNTRTIRNFDGRARGQVTMQEVLNHSLNTGVAHIVQEMGKDTFREYFLNFKLGSETGIDLPNEAYGLVENLQSPREVEYATASFGQGIAMTPIATTRALATLANGGTLVTPHLVDRIVYDNCETKEIRYPEGDRVLQPETSEEISRMLAVVVDDALRGGDVALPNHTIGAKTGTAQISDPENGGYYEDRYLHSFFGYFPVYDPEFLVFMYTVEPQGVRYASETLTDPFMDIARFLINYYSIPPDR